MKKIQIGIVGLGYVGLPLAVAFEKNFEVVGFDTNKKRVSELKIRKDINMEVTVKELSDAEKLIFTNDISDLKECNFFIITVPTPIDKNKNPDLIPILKASEMVGKLLKINDIVIYESTVYPGCTEEECVPILEKNSKLKYNKDFFCGYSPERINPGDKEHNLKNIKKIISGSNLEITDIIQNIYNKIIKAGTYKVRSIKVAEASKVIENIQRDVNIALINELSLILKKLNIDTYEVLQAASTKWNFLQFKPGLVGGHCIGVDPYYLMHKAQEVGYYPEVILSARRINDSISGHITTEIIKLMVNKKIKIDGGKVLVMGLTFKENCPDIRNSKVVEIINNLKTYKLKIDIYDPWVNIYNVEKENELICMKTKPKKGKYDAIIIAVAHNEFIKMGEVEIKSFGKKNVLIYDVKGILPKESVDGRL
jgi:UDP-N-acetyl-D-galactosamine dehydrogenase